MIREHTVRTRAKERLESVRQKVRDGEATLEEAAAAADLEVRRLRRFNRSTPERRSCGPQRLSWRKQPLNTGFRPGLV